MRRVVATVLCALSLVVTTQASADAVVRVRVRNMNNEPVDGTVQLKPLGDGKSFGCSTVKGACMISSVPGGSYIVTFRPKEGSSPNPRKVMIPPDGEADLHISAK
ncbi:MAG: hypothetical protein OES69_18955 [Myxococcales bacterium]|jgi:hypothetical protein|nr:hypothetical protein [Myxococcales bacterium]MDH3846026.1 hypothetical protein [Myxococcales bacterium]